jgi:hypothetical protein
VAAALDGRAWRDEVAPVKGFERPVSFRRVLGPPPLGR